MRFFNFFLNHMLQKYQNEIAPIIYYGNSTKTNEKYRTENILTECPCIIWSCFLSKPRIYPPLQKCSGWASHGQEMQGHKSGAKRPLQSPGTAGAAGRGWILELQTILQFEQSQRRPQLSLSPGCTMLNRCLNTVSRCEIGTLTQLQYGRH